MTALEMISNDELIHLIQLFVEELKDRADRGDGA